MAVTSLERAVAPLRDLPGAPHWSEPARWHLTLLFLGAVPREQLPALCAVAAPAVAEAPAMRLRLAGGGRFGSVRRPQVAWAGLEGDVAALTALAGRLADGARALGLEVEDRPFRAHVTLGRWRLRRPADGTLTDRLEGYRGPEWQIREVRLTESRLGATPAYETVAAWPVTTQPVTRRTP